MSDMYRTCFYVSQTMTRMEKTYCGFLYQSHFLVRRSPGLLHQPNPGYLDRTDRMTGFGSVWYRSSASDNPICSVASTAYSGTGFYLECKTDL